MNYFLAKTDPLTYSIDDMARERETVWDGVHNPTAIQVIKKWEIGDRVLIYHSQGEKKIVGLAEVVGEPYENKYDPRKSWAAELRFLEEFSDEKQVSLKEIKESGLFADFALVRLSRLSTMECPEKFVKWMRERVEI